MLLEDSCAFRGAIFYLEEFVMETRVAVISIIVENRDCVEKVNALLHEYGEHIIGRLGLPYRPKRLSIISVVLDAPQDITSALSGKIGRLSGVGVKTVYSGV
jgi:putative iron-only hydrogenase system regulator